MPITDNITLAVSKANFAWHVVTAFFLITLSTLTLCSLIDAHPTPFNYMFTGIGLIILASMLTLNHRLNCNLTYLWPAPILVGIGLLSFLHSRLYGQSLSYGSALIPISFTVLLFVLPPANPNILAAKRLFGIILSFFIMIFVSLSLAQHVIGHENVLFVILALTFFLITRSYTMALVALLAIITYTIIRPSSTIVMSSAIAFAFFTIHRLLPQKYYYASILISFTAIVLLNILAMFDPSQLVPFLELETYLKTQLLGAHTNSEFRLAVMSAASEEYASQSLLFGKLFTGTINASKMQQYLASWQHYEAPIHSDFAIVTLQGGLIGFVLFSGWLFGMLLMCRKGARTSIANNLTRSKHCFDAAMLCCLIVSFFMSFNPILQKLHIMICFYAVIWLAGMLRVVLSYAPSKVFINHRLFQVPRRKGL